MAIALDLLITPLFWTILAPGIYKDIIKDWPKYGIKVLPVAILMFSHHAVPVISTMTNLYFSDIKLLKNDWPLIIIMGLLYIPCNYIGYRTTGKAIYPIGDWKSVPFTIAVYVVVALLEAGIFYLFASHTHRKQKK